MICKANLERIGKAAYNSLSEEDKHKYSVASKVVSIISDVSNGADLDNAISEAGLVLSNIGVVDGAKAVIDMAKSIAGGTAIITLKDAILSISIRIAGIVEKLIDQLKHELAARLAVFLGIEENPGIIGAILEFVYRILVKPALS